MRTYGRVLKVLIKLRFQNLMMFRLGFWGPFFVDGSLFGIQLMVFSAVYENVERIGTWGRGEMILYIGSFSLLNAVSMLICFFGINSIPDKIRSGEMDLYLTKPISPLFRFTFEKMNPCSIMLIILSFCMIGYGIRVSDIAMYPGNVGAYVFWMILMQILYYEMEVLIRSTTFFAMSNGRITQLEGTFLEMCMQLPGVTFYGIYKVIFCFVLPYGIMATFPVQSMIGKMTWQMALQGILVVGVFTVLTGVLWKKGIRHYNSASS